MPTLCGLCGTNKVREEDAHCINGHDCWVEPRDFYNPELNAYIAAAANTLGVSIEELKRRVESDRLIVDKKSRKKRLPKL